MRHPLLFLNKMNYISRWRTYQALLWLGTVALLITIPDPQNTLKAILIAVLRLCSWPVTP